MKAPMIGGPQYRPTQPPSEPAASASVPATAFTRTSVRENQFPGLPSLPQRVDGPPRQPPAMTGGQIGGASEPLLRPTTAQPPCNVFMLSVQALNWLQTPANGHNGPDARKLAVAVLSAMTHGLLLPMQNPLQPAAIVFEARGLIDGVQGALRVRLAETQEGLNLLDIAFRPLGAMRPSMHVSMQPSQPATSMTAPPAGRALGTADASQTGSMQSLDRQHPDTSSTVSRLASEFEERDLMSAVIQLRNRQDFTGAPLPSGASIPSQSIGSDGASLSASAHEGDGAQRSSDAGASLAGSSQGGVVRTARSGIRPAPYPSSSEASGSSAVIVQANRCKHKPGGIVNTETFVGCDVTDDERANGNKKAGSRVQVRRSMHKKAVKLGVSTTAEVRKLEKTARATARGFTSLKKAQESEKDARATATGFTSRQKAEESRRDARALVTGFNSRQEAERAGREARAVDEDPTSRREAVQANKDANALANGFPSRQKAQQAGNDARALAKGFPSRQKAQEAEKDDRAEAKNFASRQEAERAGNDARATRQLGPKATRADLRKIEAGERELAKQEGVDVKEIRSRRVQADAVSPEPSSPD